MTSLRRHSVVPIWESDTIIRPSKVAYDADRITGHQCPLLDDARTSAAACATHTQVATGMDPVLVHLVVCMGGLDAYGPVIWIIGARNDLGTTDW